MGVPKRGNPERGDPEQDRQSGARLAKVVLVCEAAALLQELLSSEEPTLTVGLLALAVWLVTGGSLHKP